MSERTYTFTKIILEEQLDLIVDTYNREIDFKCDFEVFAEICEILYNDGYKIYLDGMCNEELDLHFNYKRLMQFRTVEQFRNGWPYKYLAKKG